ncbi:ADP-ribosylation factor-like protein 9 [Capricornis sumatraensis]
MNIDFRQREAISARVEESAGKAGKPGALRTRAPSPAFWSETHGLAGGRGSETLRWADEKGLSETPYPVQAHLAVARASKEATPGDAFPVAPVFPSSCGRVSRVPWPGLAPSLAPTSYSRFGESAARNPLTGERAQNAQGAARGPGVGRGWRLPRGRCTPRGPTSPPALPPQRRPLRPGSRPAAPARGRAGGGKQTRVVGMERGKVKREKGKEPEKGEIQQKGEEKNKKVEKEKIKEKEKGKEEKFKEKNGKEKTEKGKEEKIKEKENGKEKKRGKEEKIKEKENGKEEKSKRNEDEKRQERETEKEKEQFKEKEKEDNSTLIKIPLAPLEENKQILVLGLDGAGKTSILHFLALNRVQRSVAPTQGFNAVCISTGDHQMEFLEIGGSEPFRSYWEMYLSKGLLLVFVVDSADHKRLPEAKKYLHQLIGTNPVLPLVVFANKQDLEAAYHITDIHEALALSEVGNDRKMFLFGTQVTENGSEIPSIIQDARDLIAHLAADMSDQA